MSTRTAIARRFALSVLLAGSLAACAGGAPFVETSDPAGGAVNVCYDADVTTVAEVEDMVVRACRKLNEERDPAPRFLHSTTYQCRLMQPVRAHYACWPSAKEAAPKAAPGPTPDAPVVSPVSNDGPVMFPTLD